MYRFALVGCGRISKKHIEALKQLEEENKAKLAARIAAWEFDQPHPMDEEIEQANTNPTSVYGFGHLDFYTHVIEALDGNTNGIVEGREGRKTVEIIQAAYQSALSGGQVKPCAMPR